MKAESTRPANLANPITEGILEHHFVSDFDQSTQSFLEADFRSGSDVSSQLVVIYLHGAASHQDQGMTAGIYDGAFEKWATVLKQRQAIYICPEYRGSSWMGPAAEADLNQIIAATRERFPVGKLILAGGSKGGTSTLIFASRFPSAIDGVIALCPATDPALMFDSFPEQFLASYGGNYQQVPTEYDQRRTRDTAHILSALPIALVHGTGDTVIPVSHSHALIRNLEKAGGNFHYLEIPEGDHDSPLQTSFADLLDFAVQG